MRMNRRPVHGPPALHPLPDRGLRHERPLAKDASETRAVKGLLQVAERALSEKNNAAVALKIYRFLETKCAGTPLAEYVSQGISRTERRLGAASTLDPA